MDPLTSPLLTDLYEYTMLQTYIDRGMQETAVFELTFRHLPENRGFLLAAGLESLVAWLEQLRFTPDEIAFLDDTGRFSRRLLEYLAAFRFTGDVHAIPEGTVFFADEPVVRITAPLAEAQLVESRLINLVHLQTIMASKAARCVLAAAGRAKLIEFGLRRAQGAEAGLGAARAAFIAGFSGTSTVLAAERDGIPIFGTMAHSYIEAHDDETQAFVDFARANPNNTTLLIDTYDTLRGAERAVEAGRRLAGEGIRIKGVRIDSGDLASLAHSVRHILDNGGLKDATILASGNIDEYAVRLLLDQGAPINGFGIGTRLVNATDTSDPDCAYKLMEYAGRNRLKLSPGKKTRPGRKQVWRRIEKGVMVEDEVTPASVTRDGEPLLVPVMAGGKRTGTAPELGAIMERARAQLRALPAHLRRLEREPAYPVRIAPELEKLREEAAAERQ